MLGVMGQVVVIHIQTADVGPDAGKCVCLRRDAENFSSVIASLNVAFSALAS